MFFLNFKKPFACAVHTVDTRYRFRNTRCPVYNWFRIYSHIIQRYTDIFGELNELKRDERPIFEMADCGLLWPLCNVLSDLSVVEISVIFFFYPSYARSMTNVLNKPLVFVLAVKD